MESLPKQLVNRDQCLLFLQELGIAIRGETLANPIRDTAAFHYCIFPLYPELTQRDQEISGLPVLCPSLWKQTGPECTGLSEDLEAHLSFGTLASRCSSTVGDQALCPLRRGQQGTKQGRRQGTYSFSMFLELGSKSLEVRVGPPDRTLGQGQGTWQAEDCTGTEASVRASFQGNRTSALGSDRGRVALGGTPMRGLVPTAPPSLYRPCPVVL